MSNLPRLMLVAWLGLTACDEASEPPATVDGAQEPVQAAPAERRLLIARGAVSVDGKPATEGTPIGEASTVQTGPDGYAVLTLGKGSAVEVRANSKLTLGSSPRAKTTLQLVAGMVWSFLPDGASYEVQTPNAVAGVRGTVFFVQADARGSYICACKGAVRMETADGKTRREVTTKPGHEHLGFSVSKRGKRDKLGKAPMKHHTDAEAEALAPTLESVR
ncbi:MAG: FecR domain-containing protein [Deltaproteobacteria bacterium]|nr:FecR domain-containing protein [Deltaproteobacteria bacterium]